MNIVTCRGCRHLPYGMPGYCIHCPEDVNIRRIFSNLTRALNQEDSRIYVPLADITWCSNTAYLKRGCV